MLRFGSHFIDFYGEYLRHASEFSFGKPQIKHKRTSGHYTTGLPTAAHRGQGPWKFRGVQANVDTQHVRVQQTFHGETFTDVRVFSESRCSLLGPYL